MEFISSVFNMVLGFFKDNEVLTALLAVVGGLKIVAKRTKTPWDDKVLNVIEWPLRKGYELLGKVVGPGSPSGKGK